MSLTPASPTTPPPPPAPAFNLLDSPWLPVRYLDGRNAELGLLALFEQAAQIEGLAETSPPNLVALYRLLLAITHRALARQLGQWTDRDRARWYAQGLPAGAVADYLAHWRDRFWLFHAEQPFMQVAALATADETRDKLKPWTRIALGSANGNNPSVFDHALDTAPVEITAASAVRHLLGFLQFAPPGLVQVFRESDKNGPLANTAAALPLGASLEQTLLLALHPAPATGSATLDRPCWEAVAPDLSDLRADPTPASGCCDRYTRQSRSVLLILDQAAPMPTVRWIRFGAGIRLAEDDNAPDPMASYRAGSEGLIRVTFAEGRAIWRDMSALLPDASGRLARPAAVLSWATNLHDAAHNFDSEVPVLLAGVCAEPRKVAKIARWRLVRYRLPIGSLVQAELATEVRTQLRRCEDLFFKIEAIACELLVLTMPNSKSKEAKKTARAVLDAGPFAATFFATAERRLPVLLRLIGQAELDAAHAEWSAALLAAANGAWDAARGMLGQSAAALRAEALTHPKLLAALRPLRPEPDPATIQEPTNAEEATP